jgi:hypothetical protein
MTAPQRFRKKPVEIEAMQWSGAAEDAHPIIQWINGTEGHTAVWREEQPRVRVPLIPQMDQDFRPEGIFIRTLEGEMHVSSGDFVIRGVKGKFYPCKPDIFAETYHPVLGASL